MQALLPAAYRLHHVHQEERELIDYMSSSKTFMVADCGTPNGCLLACARQSVLARVCLRSKCELPACPCLSSERTRQSVLAVTCLP